VHHCTCVEKKNHLDATEWFIALIIKMFRALLCPLPPMVCDALLVGRWMSDAGQPAMR